DHLCIHGLSSMFAEEQHVSTGEARLLPEAHDEPEVQQPQGETATSAPVTPEVTTQPYQFQPKTLYVGTLMKAAPRKGKAPGGIMVETEHGPLTCYFWSRPDALKEEEDWS